MGQITNLLTPWSRVLIEKLTGFAANQEIPRILWNSKVHYRTHKSLFLSLANSIQSPQPLPTSWRSINIILSSTFWSPHWSLSLRFPHQNLVHTSPFLHTCHMPHPSYSSRFYHPHNIGWGVQIIWSTIKPRNFVGVLVGISLLLQVMLISIWLLVLVTKLVNWVLVRFKKSKLCLNQPFKILNTMLIVFI